MTIKKEEKIVEEILEKNDNSLVKDETKKVVTTKKVIKKVVKTVKVKKSKDILLNFKVTTKIGNKSYTGQHKVSKEIVKGLEPFIKKGSIVIL